MNYTLDLWLKPGKRTLNVNIISTNPPVKKLSEIKDYLMVYIWNTMSSKVEGDPAGFARLTVVTISEHHQLIRLTLPQDIASLLMKDPNGEFSTLNETKVVYNLSLTDPKATGKATHPATEHFLFLEHTEEETPPLPVMLKAVTTVLAPLGIQVIFMDTRFSKDTDVQTALASFHIGFNLSEMGRERSVNEFTKIKRITIGKIPFTIHFSRSFMSRASICADCYTWIRWPTDEQAVSFGDDRYTQCMPCARERAKKEAHPKVSAAAKKRAADAFLEAAMKKVQKP